MNPSVGPPRSSLSPRWFCFDLFLSWFLILAVPFIIVFICAHIMIPPMLYIHISHAHSYALTFSTS